MRVLCFILLGFMLSVRGYAQGAVVLNPSMVDLGNVTQVSKKDVTLYNNQEIPLVITKIKSHCGCAKTSYVKAPIMPGDSTKITIRYNPKIDATGVFYKTIKIHTTYSLEPISLVVRGVNKFILD